MLTRVLFTALFVIFAVCVIYGIILSQKMLYVLQDENVSVTFADRWLFPMNFVNKYLRFVHTRPDSDKKTEYMGLYKKFQLCWGISIGIVITLILLVNFSVI